MVVARFAVEVNSTSRSLCWVSTFDEKLLLLDNNTIIENRTDENKTLSSYGRWFARGEADWGAASVGAVADECQRKLGKEEEKRALVVTSCKEKEADDRESDGRRRNSTGEAAALFVVSTIEKTEHRFDGYEAVIEQAAVAATKGSRTTGTTNDERGWKITTERDQ
ncbi:hypothetical protein BHE74_00032578 [Ensete ventricosum]|nr:hypothetical protein BHE74_00032578 [Ensete ventricosum]